MTDTATIRDFIRDPYVVAAARIRAGQCCEMPACETRLFTQEDGTVFLEVHHIVPLSEGGVDELLNAAALCPMCHRELHHGKRRLTSVRDCALPFWPSRSRPPVLPAPMPTANS